jgi:hypothetical protein
MMTILIYLDKIKEKLKSANMSSLLIQVEELRENFDYVALNLWLLKSEWENSHYADTCRENVNLFIHKIDFSQIDLSQIHSAIERSSYNILFISEAFNSTIKETDLQNVQSVERSLNLIGWSHSTLINQLKSANYKEQLKGRLN